MFKLVSIETCVATIATYMYNPDETAESAKRSAINYLMNEYTRDDHLPTFNAHG